MRPVISPGRATATLVAQGCRSWFEPVRTGMFGRFGRGWLEERLHDGTRHHGLETEAHRARHPTHKSATGTDEQGDIDRWIEVMVERRLVGRDTTFVGRVWRGWLEEGFGDGACYGVGR